MEVILREEVPNLGTVGDIVKVKPGYARNYLIPQGKATLATEGNVREIEHQKRVVADRVARELKALGVEKSRLESLLLEVKANVGEEGKLFGSVTVVQIAELIASKGIDLDRRKIQLDEPIKEIGERDRSTWEWSISNQGSQDSRLLLTARLIDKNSNEILLLQQEHAIASSNAVRQVRNYLQPIPLAAGVVLGFLLFGVVGIFRRPKSKNVPPAKIPADSPEPPSYTGKKRL